jgi:hypothetical protein
MSQFNNADSVFSVVIIFQLIEHLVPVIRRHPSILDPDQTSQQLGVNSQKEIIAITAKRIVHNIDVEVVPQQVSQMLSNFHPRLMIARCGDFTNAVVAKYYDHSLAHSMRYNCVENFRIPSLLDKSTKKICFNA